MRPTYLEKSELWPEDNLPDSFLRRAKATLKFIDPFQGPAIDIGEENPLKQMLIDNFKTDIQSTNIDLDREKITGKYKTIFCFEVLEHLYNPLFFLENLRNVLDDEGVMYLSTPCQPHLLWAKHHYHEIDNKRLHWLFTEAKLKVIKRDKATIAGYPWQHMYGFRPILRYFQNTRLFKLGAT